MTQVQFHYAKHLIKNNWLTIENIRINYFGKRRENGGWFFFFIAFVAKKKTFNYTSMPYCSSRIFTSQSATANVSNYYTWNEPAEIDTNLCVFLCCYIFSSFVHNSSGLWMTFPLNLLFCTNLFWIKVLESLKKKTKSSLIIFLVVNWH